MLVSLDSLLGLDQFQHGVTDCVCMCLQAHAQYVWVAPAEKAAQQHNSNLRWFDNSCFVFVSTVACCPTNTV